MGRLFQSCMSNVRRVAAPAEREKQAARKQIRTHCYSSNLADYIKMHGLILTKSCQDLEQNVFSLYAKLWMCLLCDISIIDQPLFGGWGQPLTGGIIIWLARALWTLGARKHVIGLHWLKKICINISSNGTNGKEFITFISRKGLQSRLLLCASAFVLPPM